MGRMKIKTDQLNDTCEYVYDLAGRMTSKEHKSGGAVESTDTFTYDAASRLTQSHKGRYNVTTTHSFTADGMPLTEGLTVHGRTYGLSRSYDEGNRPRYHYIADGSEMEWRYTDHNLVNRSIIWGQTYYKKSV